MDSIMNLFRTHFDHWLDRYDCELAIAFDNQTEHDSFNAFIKAQYNVMLESQQEAAHEARDELLGFKTTK